MNIRNGGASSLYQSPNSPPTSFPAGAELSALWNRRGFVSKVWNWFCERSNARTKNQRLHVTATASLGEKRFAAVIEIEGHRFLIGGGATNVGLLAQLEPKEPFAYLLGETTSDAAGGPAGQTGRSHAESTIAPLPQVKATRTKKTSSAVMKATLRPLPNLAAKRAATPASPLYVCRETKEKKAADSPRRIIEQPVTKPAAMQKKKRTVKQRADQVLKVKPAVNSAPKRRVKAL